MTYKVLDRKKFRDAMYAAGMYGVGRDIERIIDYAVELRLAYIAGAPGNYSREEIEQIETRKCDAHYNLDCALRALNLLGFPEEV